MNDRTIDYLDAPKEWPEVVNDARSGGTVLLQEANKTVAVIISFEDYLAVQELLEDRHDARKADAAYEKYLRDPSKTVSWEDAKSILRTDGLLDEQ